jgi:hypothetical protein
MTDEHPSSEQLVAASFTLLTLFCGSILALMLHSPTQAGEPVVISTANLLMMLNDALCHSPVLVQGYGIGGPAELFHLPFPQPNEWLDTTGDGVGNRVPSLTAVAEIDGSGSSNVGSAATSDAVPSASTSGAPKEPVRDEKMQWDATCRKLFASDAVKEVGRQLDLQHNCGYVTLVRPRPAGAPLERSKANNGAGGGSGDGDGVHGSEAVADDEWVVFNVSFGMHGARVSIKRHMLLEHAIGFPCLLL